MTSRGKNYKSQEWDPMRDEYNSSTYEAQYGEDDGGDGPMNLDHRRLYITNIPVCLNDEGLHSAFAKYGTITEAFVSKDPTKRYALVSFETAGEAKLAMMKMNKTEPLKLNLSIAKKKRNYNNDTKADKSRSTMNSGRDRNSYKERDDAMSTGSKTRHSRKDEMLDGEDEMANGFPVEEDMSLTDALDASWSLEMESLRLEHLKLREEQLLCKQRMMLIKQNEKKPVSQNSTSTRCLLPDGRIIVRNSDRVSESRDADATYAAGAGDSLTMPSLQRERVRACVRCGGAADAYCSRCGLTPYCGTACQQRDWRERHSAVCHNLARLASQNKPEPDLSNLPRAPPLRRPHSPAPDRDSARHNERDEHNDRQNKNYRQGDKNPNAGNRNNNRNPGKFVKKFNGRQNTRDEARDDDNNQNTQQSKQQNATPEKRSASPKPSPKREIPAKIEAPPRQEVIPPKEVVPKQEPLPKMKSPKVEAVKEEVKARPSRVQFMESIKAKVNSQVKEEPKLVPKTYILQHLSIGDTVIMSVDNLASLCAGQGSGYVCLAMHETYEADYQRLCEDYVLDCEADANVYKPSPGDSLSYLQPEDGAWYRARCLTPTTIALLDASKTIRLKPTDNCKALPPKYQDIPEFCCLLESNDVEVGANIRCTLLAKTPRGFKVSIFDVDNGAEIGSGEVMRWIPLVEYPKPVVAAPPRVPSPTRPPLVNGTRASICDVQQNRICVLSADEKAQTAFHSVMEDVALYGASASPLSSPPSPGDTVVAQYSDGLHYRALLQRTNVASNKYKIQYLEYGNVEVTSLQKLYACPSEFDSSSVPPLSSILMLDVQTPLTPPAEQYLERLKQEVVVLALPDGSSTAPSGSVANLTVADSKEDVTKKLRELTKPEWKKLEEKGGDVLETPCLTYEDLECSELPASGLLEVLDAGELQEGSLSVCGANDKHAKYVFTTLADRMAAYCNSALGRQPYLPTKTELCITQLPPGTQWYRAVFLDQPGGPGGDTAEVLYVDTGYVGEVKVDTIRKMMPEFTKGLPAVACHLQIKGFPKHPSKEMLSRAIKHMKMDERGRGQLLVDSCVKVDDTVYLAEAKNLLRAVIQA